MNLNNTLLQSKSQNQEAEMRAVEGAKIGAQLEAQAMDDALWRMAANNAMAKIKGFNNLASKANDLS